MDNITSLDSYKSPIELGQVYFDPDPRREKMEEPKSIKIRWKHNDLIVGYIDKVHVYDDYYAWHFSIIKPDSYHGQVCQHEYAYRGNWLMDVLFEIENGYYVWCHQLYPIETG